MSTRKAILTIPGAIGAAVERVVYEHTGDTKTATAAGQIAKWGTIMATADIISGTVETVVELTIGVVTEHTVETAIQEVGTAVVAIPLGFVVNSQKNDNGSGSNYNGNTQVGNGNALSA